MKQARNTVAKTEILTLLSRSAVALAPAEILARAAGLCDRVTVYRVLDRLQEEGHIHKIIDRDGGVKYARCRQCTDAGHHHSHAHFSCQACQAVTCLETVHPHFTLPGAYRVHEVQFTLSGLCPKCA